jgi:hypothetical protein
MHGEQHAEPLLHSPGAADFVGRIMIIEHPIGSTVPRKVGPGQSERLSDEKRFPLCRYLGGRKSRLLRLLQPLGGLDVSMPEPDSDGSLGQPGL